MALIDLNLIVQLEAQAKVGQQKMQLGCFNWPGDPEISPEEFVQVMKWASQATLLRTHFEYLYFAASDFAKGNFQPYIDRYNSLLKPNDLQHYGPFDELYYSFDRKTGFSLPPTIEQFTELLILLPGFSERRKDIDKRTWGESPNYLVVEGDTQRLVPESELPDGWLNIAEANREIDAVQVEYCLDNYNAFYQQCLTLILEHKTKGTIVECAKAILLLFAPYTKDQTQGDYRV